MQRAIRKFRRALAYFILGDQLALFMPKADCNRARVNDFISMDDATLAAYTRWFFDVMAPIYHREAKESDVGVSVYSNMHGALSFVRTAIESNASELEVVQRCAFRGEDVGIWRIHLSRLDEYDFKEPGVEETWDGDKLVRFTVTRDFTKEQQ